MSLLQISTQTFLPYSRCIYPTVYGHLYLSIYQASHTQHAPKLNSPKLHHCFHLVSWQLHPSSGLGQNLRSILVFFWHPSSHKIMPTVYSKYLQSPTTCLCLHLQHPVLRHHWLFLDPSNSLLTGFPPSLLPSIKFSMQLTEWAFKKCKS